jgi:hypothetical protein
MLVIAIGAVAVLGFWLSANQVSTRFLRSMKNGDVPEKRTLGFGLMPDALANRMPASVVAVGSVIGAQLAGHFGSLTVRRRSQARCRVSTEALWRR